MSETPAPITPEVVAAHGLSEDEYARVLHALGREPNLLELGIFSVMWSEHCSYKSSRLHLKKLPTEAPWVICGPGENAGVIDIGDGPDGTKLACIFKMESHNHPSYIEPYQGAATGVGGILRDVFTMGARPIADVDHPRVLARPADHPRGFGGQLLEVEAARLVAAMLGPHDREDAQFGQVWLAPQRMQHARVFFGVEAVRLDDMGGNLGHGPAP